MLKKSGILFLFSLFLLSFDSISDSSDSWQLKKSENGIFVYTRNAQGSDYKELKAVYQIKTSMSSVIALLNDVDSYPQWIYKCERSKLIKKSSDQDLIRYQSIVAPWPVDNRDMVLEAHSYQDPKTGIVYQEVKCLPDHIPAVKDHVRIREFRARWTITPLKNGIIEVQYELLLNPGGNIPAWLVNMAVVDGPYDTSVKMKEWLMKEKYKSAHYSFINDPE